MLPHNVHMAAVRNLSDESLSITCTYAFNRYEQSIPSLLLNCKKTLASSPCKSWHLWGQSHFEFKKMID